MYCKKCGNTINHNDDFCSKCGCKITQKKSNLGDNNDSGVNTRKFYVPRPAIVLIVFLIIILVFVILYTISTKREEKFHKDYSLISNTWEYNNQEYNIERIDETFKSLSSYDSYRISNFSDFISDLNIIIPENKDIYVQATDDYNLNENAIKNYKEKGIYIMFADQELNIYDNSARDYSHVYDCLVVTNISEDAMTIKNSSGQSFSLIKLNNS